MADNKPIVAYEQRKKATVTPYDDIGRDIEDIEYRILYIENRKNFLTILY